MNAVIAARVSIVLAVSRSILTVIQGPGHLHARTHTLTPLHMDPSSDDDNERSFSFTGSTLSSDTLSSHSRSNSTASVSSTDPRKSHAPDDDTAQDDFRPEKRSRINPH
ncbi:hypothetical protein E4T56_gene14315 [Termitomyces sp. T112]|nr:hypothetical protein E4T56_gene14315 [Termitomyces sp. T112]